MLMIRSGTVWQRWAIFLLRIDSADSRETVVFLLGKIFAQNKLFVNSGKVRQIAQLLSYRPADLFRRLLTAAAELQEISMRLSPVSAWLSAISRIMLLIQSLFCVFPGLIQQGRVLRVTNIGWCAGSVHDQSAE